MSFRDLGLEALLQQALAEDLGSGDITTEILIPPHQQSRAKVIAKEKGVLAGLPQALTVFDLLGPLEKNIYFTEGSNIAKGDVLCLLEGQTALLLSGERLFLNLLQRTCGIATKTRHLQSKIAQFKAELVDTRKTTPLWRKLEKYAVQVGGGNNHRFGLFDLILIKDNHIEAVGGVKEAVTQARKKARHNLKIEVETQNLADVKEAIAAKADIILLDNMPLSMMKEALNIIDGKALVEASGNINESNIKEIAAIGVDIVSMGALTHSVSALDISLDFCDEQK